MASSLNEFLPLLGNQDTKKRVQLGSDILAYLENPENSIDIEELSTFIDAITTWINSSNFKVAQHGLEIMGHFADRLKDDFKPYLSDVVPPAIDRLGDSKDSVREQARLFILKLNTIATPQHLFEKLIPAFQHKNWKVREEILLCLQETLDRHGAPSLSISKMMPAIVKLLGDPNSQVRDIAFSTIVEIYKHVGERVRHDLCKKYNVPAAKQQALNQKFDEVKNSGGLLLTASNEGGHRPATTEDETDSRSQHSGSSEADGNVVKAQAKRATSAPPVRRALASKPPSSSSAGPAGAADEEMFIRSFEDVPRIQIFSAKEVDQELSKIRNILSDTSTHWEKRIDSLKRIRSLLLAGGAEYDEFYSNLKSLHHPFQLSVKDLRSQVVREACITIAYLSQQLGLKLDHFAEALLPSLINLIPNSAKIMSTAGIVAIRFIIQHTHASRLIPIIASNLQSKSKDIRRTCCEFLDQLLHTWPTSSIERHTAVVSEAIRRGVSDADPEARAFARKAFWGLADHFRDQADALLASLDPSKQRMLQGESAAMSNSSSSNSLHTVGSGKSHHRPPATMGSIENLNRGNNYGTPVRKSGIPILSNSKPEGMVFPSSTLRSNSAIDLAAARRAKIRALYPPPAASRHFTRPPSRAATSSKTSTCLSAITSPERVSRSRTKGVSQSQPSSRSGSPSSRLSYSNSSTYHPALDGTSTTGRGRRKSGIPTPTSRDASPSRSTGFGGYERRLSLGSRSRSLLGAGERYPPPTTITTTEPLMAERILQQSQEAEVAMADALRGPAKRRYNAFDDQSDESETSSVCSDRSYGSYTARNVDDISESIHMLSTSVHWSERKEGLLTLQAYLRYGRVLSPSDLRRATDGLAKLLADPHTKTVALVVDTLHEVVRAHRAELRLHSLLPRLFLRLGASDLLASVHAKILRTLDFIREVFPFEDQLCILMKFISDHTQTPNLKVKLSVLNYLNQMLPYLDPSEFTSYKQENRTGIIKLLNWATDPKSAELRKHAQDAVVALFHANSPEFSLLINQLPKNYQDSAFSLLQQCGKGGRSTPSPLMLHPNSSSPRLPSRSANRSLEKEDTENLNPEEVFNSLKRTADEIHRYRSDALEKDGVDSNTSPGAKPYRPALYQDHRDVRNGYHPTLVEEANGSGNIMEDQERILSAAVADLKSPASGSNDQRKKALSHLVTLAKEGAPALWDEYFRHVLRLIIETVGNTDGSVRTLALRTLCELIKHQPHHFQDYVELTILKILEASKDSDKDVLRAAEVCAGVAANVLPPEQTARTLKPIIMTGDYPVNLAAIKMFTKLVEQQGDPIVQQLLPDIIPAIIKAYDSLQSSVRKAAVFCMVAIYGVVGDALYPHLKSLNGSKLKLLNLYIQRAQGQSSGSTPGSPATTSSSH